MQLWVYAAAVFDLPRALGSRTAVVMEYTAHWLSQHCMEWHHCWNDVDDEHLDGMMSALLDPLQSQCQAESDSVTMARSTCVLSTELKGTQLWSICYVEVADVAARVGRLSSCVTLDVPEALDVTPRCCSAVCANLICS